MPENHKAFSRTPNLGKLTLALIENAVSPVIGKDAVQVIKGPYSNRELFDQLCETLTRAEDRFRQECTDTDLVMGLVQLKLADLETLRKSFWQFARNPASPEFPQAVYKQLSAAFPTIPDARRKAAVTHYMRILRDEMVAINGDVREKLGVAAMLQLEDGVKQIVQNTEKMVDRLDNLVALIAPERKFTYQPAMEEAEPCNAPVFTTDSKTLVLYDGSAKGVSVLVDSISKGLQGKTGLHRHDFNTPIHEDWVETIHNQIEQADFILPIITEACVYNEMLLLELQIASRLKKAVIPVRFGFELPFPYPLVDYVCERRWIVWNSKEKIEALCGTIERALRGDEFGIPQPDHVSALAIPVETYIFKPAPIADPDGIELQLASPKGTMGVNSPFYIEREEDRSLHQALMATRSVITIKAPRQMGKSSLLVRGMRIAEAAGRKVVYIDFQRFEDAVLQSPSMFFKSFAYAIAKKLQLAVDVKEFWEHRSGLQGDVMTCSDFVEEQVLGHVPDHIILALDEVDRMLDCPFRSDFFGMLRSWYNDVSPDNEPWGRLNLMLVISTEPLLLISNISQSPFNIGDILQPEDFTIQQTIEMNRLHKKPFSEEQLLRLRRLVGGHPYLLRQAMFNVCTQQYSAEELLARAAEENGPYHDHLLRYLFHLKEHKDLEGAMKQILSSQASPSESLTHRLRSAGLVTSLGDKVVPKYGIYSIYFEKYSR